MICSFRIFVPYSFRVWERFFVVGTLRPKFKSIDDYSVILLKQVGRLLDLENSLNPVGFLWNSSEFRPIRLDHPSWLPQMYSSNNCTENNKDRTVPEKFIKIIIVSPCWMIRSSTSTFLSFLHYFKKKHVMMQVWRVERKINWYSTSYMSWYIGVITFFLETIHFLQILVQFFFLCLDWPNHLTPHITRMPSETKVLSMKKCSRRWSFEKKDNYRNVVPNIYD